LSYEKGLYGPYAANLRHVLNVIEGHFITGYADADDNPDKQIELKPNVIKAADDVLKAHPETTSHLERVADLISGFETPYGMELLSTVHWVATHDRATTSERVIRKTYAWNNRKRMFQEKHIRIAFNTLAKKGWIQRSEL